jgi:hypothetical protein
LTLLALWREVASTFVNFVNSVSFVRTRIAHQFSLAEKEISHKVHKGHEVHKQDHFSISAPLW